MNKNVPKLRFKEFSDEWEEVSFKKIFNKFEYGMNSAAIDFDGINKYIRITDIDEETNKYKCENKVSPDGNLEEKYLVKENDILFARTGASVGKTYLYDNKDGILYFAGFLIRGNVKSENNSKFIFTHTQTSKYKKWIKVMSIRSGQPGINSQEYSNYKCYLPSLEEQERIGNFFSIIDKIIEEQEGKVKDLELYKKGMMQKIFKQEIRFKDDNGLDYPEWEEKKITEIFNITRGQVIAKTSISPIKIDKLIYPVYSSQTSNYGILGYDSSYDFDGEFLTWTTDGANAGKVFKRNGKFRCTNVCGLLVEKDITKGFANECIKEILEKETPKHVSYVGNPKLMNGVMGDIKIRIPLLEEQRKISDFLSNIDNIVEEENKKLEDLRQFKKGLLQQMFV